MIRTGADSVCVGHLRSSPNHGERLGQAVPDSIILHYTGMADGATAVAWLCDPVSQVSCHYVVEEDGTILQLVPETRRAWHAGRSSWQGVTDMNSASIGIEIVNGGHDAGLPPFPAIQIHALIALTRDIVTRHRIRPERLLAHSDIAPGRKRDPGERFPWGELYAEGLGCWVPEAQGAVERLDHDVNMIEHDIVRQPVPTFGHHALEDQGPQIVALQRALGEYGYAIETTGLFDEATRVVVSAFQRHFRPSRVDGIADAETRAILGALNRMTARSRP